VTPPFARYEVLPTPRYYLGEGPIWTPATQSLSWIDIEEGLVLTAPFVTRRLGPISTLEVGGVVGCAVPAIGGGFVVSLECWLGFLDDEGRLSKSRELIPANRRFNDGKADPQGRLVVGSLPRYGPPDGRQHLLRLEHDGTLTVIDDDLNQSNGMGWSPDGHQFYNVDTTTRTLFVRDYSFDGVGQRRILAVLDGHPDGITVDAEGNIWVTLIDIFRVDCITPQGIRVPSRSLYLPDHHPTSIEFVGEALTDIVITTGYPRPERSEGPPVRVPRDGELLLVQNVGNGTPSTLWQPTRLPPRDLPIEPTLEDVLPERYR
jgi:sugar lactone lactonase YvrE